MVVAWRSCSKRRRRPACWIGCWILVSLFCFRDFIFNGTKSNSELKRRVLETYEFKETDYLIKTPGCYIPNYMKTMRLEETIITKNITCGVRAVFIKKSDHDNKIQFLVNDTLMKKQSRNKEYDCCYQFVKRSTETGQEDEQVIYSKCTKFITGSMVELEEEVIKVSCTTFPYFSNFYEDAYIILKKIVTNAREVEEHWNVLVMGMDSVSRMKMLGTMPETVRYLKRHNWLDYKGYHKVSFNTYPNLMSFLTGRNMSTKDMLLHSSDKKCAKGMSDCNNDMIWKKFKDSGYITAFGEDFLSLPDTFSPFHGFKIQPTDHYLRPLFLTGETSRGYLICTQKLPSAIHALQYATQFADAYKNNKFFGMFWLNSYTHNQENVPSLLDKDMKNFFVQLNRTGALLNTFIFLLSDHGSNFGKMKLQVESYYEERLPMFFVWVPLDFRKKHKHAYYNLQLNQNRLTTPYDLHETFKTILRLSSDTDFSEKSEGCPECTSLFEEKFENRTCENARVNEKWCSCHNLTKVDKREPRVNRSIQLAVSYIQNISKTVNTAECTKCLDLTLNNVLRVHSHIDFIHNKTYYVIAYEMSPGEVTFEASVLENDKGLHILEPIRAIKKYNCRSYCALERDDQAYCVCEQVKPCNNSTSISPFSFVIAILGVCGFVLLVFMLFCRNFGHKKIVEMII